MEELLYAYNKMTKAALNALRRASCFLKKKKKSVIAFKPVNQYYLKSCKKVLAHKSGSFLK